MNKKLIEKLIRDGNLSNFNEEEMGQIEEIVDEIVQSDTDVNGIQYIDYRYYIEDVGCIELYGKEEDNETETVYKDSQIRCYGLEHEELSRDEFIEKYDSVTKWVIRWQ